MAMAYKWQTLTALLAFLTLATRPARACVDLTAELVDFPHCLELQAGVYSLAWKTDADNIWLALDLKTDADDVWAGIGLSEGGGMKGSDLLVVAKVPGGGLTVQDLWSEAFDLPTIDKLQDVVLVAPLASGQAADASTPAEVAARLTQKPGHLRVLLRRKLNSCDTFDLPVQLGVPQTVVWAHGTDWPNYHGGTTRGNLVINFAPMEGDTITTAPPATLPPNMMTLDVQMPNVTIPTAKTSYLCTHVQLPSDRKYHIVAHEGIIRSKYVHHVVLYACTAPPPQLGDLYDCLSMEQACSTLTLAWAPGVGYEEMPKEAGLPFGTGPADEMLTPWFALQLHYDNREQLTIPEPDDSGLRIYYTAELRPQDMGLLFLVQPDLTIPAFKSRVVARPSLCPGSCTERMTQPLTMTYVLMHMHQAGASISVRHVRGNAELPHIGRRRFWDFNFQGMSAVPLSTRQLLPGDALITQCTYNTVDRTTTTTFGEGSLDEMCIAGILYYPKQRADLCFDMGPGSDLAYCAGQADMDPAWDSLPPEQMGQAMLEAGLLVNSTMPRFTRYTDATCIAPAQSAASAQSAP